MTLVSAKSEGSSPQDTQNDPAFSPPASTPPRWPDFYQQPVKNDIIDSTDWERDVFEEDAPLILKHFLMDVEQRRATMESMEMTFQLDPEVGDWVMNHCDIVCERFPGMLELTDDMIIVTFPTLMHRVMVVVVYNVIVARKLGRQLYVKENVDYPTEGWGSKNLGLAIFTQNPEKDFKDLWPLFIFEIAYADSGQKCLRDLLKALLGIYHQGEIGGGIAAKVFKNTNGEITKVAYSLVSFILDGTQGRKETKHRDLESFQLYVKLPHTPKEKGIWIPSEGEHTDIGTKFRTYRNANDLGVRYYSGAVLVNSGVIDENSLTPEHDIVIDAKVLGLGGDAEPMCLRAKDIWVEVRHQHQMSRQQKRARSVETDVNVSEKRYRLDISGSSVRNWDPETKTFKLNRST